MTDRLFIAVVGAARASDEDRAAAGEVGRLIAEAGAVVIGGGLGGAMAAACQGARSVGGTTIGILPGTDRTEANEHVEIAIATGMGEARNVIVVANADAVVAVGGEFGTLSEIALALKAGTAVIGIGSWELARAGAPVDGVVPAAGPREAVTLALQAARRDR
jgi:hypothetical protein